MNSLLVNGVEKTTTTSPRNILIQSVAGGGKSTLCNRLAYLWANNSAEIQRLDNFDLVFLIKVNLIQPDDKSIYDYINNELLFDVDNICDVIKDVRMLFIVDGYDELRGKENVVEDLLAKRVCPQSTVISVSEIVEEMWEAAVRCRNLEEVRADEDNTDVSAKRLESVLRKLSESAGIHALKLRKIVELDLKRRVMEEYTIVIVLLFIVVLVTLFGKGGRGVTWSHALKFFGDIKITPGEMRLSE